MQPITRCLKRKLDWRRTFSQSTRHDIVKDVRQLEDRIIPKYQETPSTDLLCLQWPSPPRNILLTKKANAPNVTASLLEYATHIHTTYPGTSLVFEPHTATSIADALPFDIYAPLSDSSSIPTSNSLLPQKIDLTCTLGGDGTILRAAALFASAPSPPPILSFSMGTIGFLGEWKFAEYKRAFREVYMSGAEAGAGSSVAMEEPSTHDSARRPHERSVKAPNEHNDDDDNGRGLTGWSSIRGKAMGPARGARVLVRNRLQVGVFARDGSRVSASAADQASPPSPPSTSAADSDIYALNEVLIHRGRDPHLAIVDVFVGGRHLTEAVADGMIVSTPTGSTAYALSSGGSIVHPLVSSLLLTPICPRSLSFRPLVLPANTPVTLRLSEKNRAREVEVSVDGVRRSEGMGVGMEVRVRGEEIRGGRGQWVGGVPSIVRGAIGAESMTGDDHWVGGLNGLLKFNYPFGGEA